MRRSPFFRHCEIVQISQFFFRNILLFPPSIFDILQQNGCSKIPKGPLFYIFWHYATYRKLQKIFGKILPHFLVFLELFLSPVVEKVDSSLFEP